MLGLFALCLATPGLGWSEPTPSMLGNPCIACHGPGGRSIGTIPSLSGYPSEVIVSAMRAFRDGSRPGATIMGPIARGYSDSEIEALGEFFGRP